MRIPRFHLRTLMILILAAGLALGAWHQVGRMDAIERERLRGGSILLVAFLVIVAFKFGLIFFLRARRRPPEGSRPSGPVDPLS